jgi:hypothetical protein
MNEEVLVGFDAIAAYLKTSESTLRRERKKWRAENPAPIIFREVGQGAERRRVAISEKGLIFKWWFQISPKDKDLLGKSENDRS